LLADTEAHIAKLDIRSRYPFTLRWTAALLPVSGTLLALAALLYHPQRGQATPAKDLDQPLANAAKVEQKMKKLEKKPREQKKAMKEGDLDKAREEVDRLAKKLEDNKLSEKEKEQLDKQLQDVKDNIQRLADQDKEEERLEELARKGDLDPDEAQRQLNQLRK